MNLGDAAKSCVYAISKVDEAAAWFRAVSLPTTIHICTIERCCVRKQVAAAHFLDLAAECVHNKTEHMFLLILILRNERH